MIRLLNLDVFGLIMQKIMINSHMMAKSFMMKILSRNLMVMAAL